MSDILSQSFKKSLKREYINLVKERYDSVINDILVVFIEKEINVDELESLYWNKISRLKLTYWKK